MLFRSESQRRRKEAAQLGHQGIRRDSKGNQLMLIRNEESQGRREDGAQPGHQGIRRESKGNQLMLIRNAWAHDGTDGGGGMSTIRFGDLLICIVLNVCF